MMKIAICDDDKQQVLLIYQLVNEYLSSNYKGVKFEIFSFDNSSELLFEIENGRHFDIFLLDVLMPHINGIKLATTIRTKDQIAKIIFLTSSLEFAVDSYNVDAYNYLLKPIQEEKLFLTLEKIFNHFSYAISDYIIVKTPACLVKVFLYNLIYLEVIKRKIYFHLKDESIIESNGTFFQIEAILLKDKRFIKPYRSFIVNLDHIKSLSSQVITTTNKKTIPVSRNLHKEVKQAYINYSFNENI